MLSLHFELEARKIDKRKVVFESGQSFRYDTGEALAASLHCHAEYELLYISEGHGKEFVCDAVREYSAGELVLIGKNLPHLYLADKGSGTENKCWILQFPRDLFPENMKEVPEYSAIGRLLENSARGILFRSYETKNRICRMASRINKLYGINSVLTLLKLLDILSRENDTELLSTLDYHNPLSKYVVDDPVSIIYSYMVNNHREEITIEALARQVGMNPASLCRYYKQRTGKTIFNTLAEIRVGCACKLLVETDLTVSEIAWRSGFRNQAHFNK